MLCSETAVECYRIVVDVCFFFFFCINKILKEDTGRMNQFFGHKYLINVSLS